MGVETKKRRWQTQSSPAEKNFGDRLKSWPEQVKTFYNDVRTETRKVTAPSWKEVRATTAVVVVTVAIFWRVFLRHRRSYHERRRRLVQLFHEVRAGRAELEFNLIMQDEEKNEAGTGGEGEQQPASADGVAATAEAPRKPEHEVVHHPLLFGV